MDKVDPNTDFGSHLSCVRAVAKGGEPESCFDLKFKLECGHTIKVTSHRQLGSCPACGTMLFRCPECQEGVRPAKWQMPPELEPYRNFLSDAGVSVEQTMGNYEQPSIDFLMEPAGRALSVHTQIGLLLKLRAAGLLKEVPPCPLEEKKGVKP